jgi:serine protease Do
MNRSRLNQTASFSIALLIAVLITGQLLDKTPTASATIDKSSLNVATALSDAFAQVADQSLPAVVTITSERVVTVDSGMMGNSPFPDFFEHFMPSPRNNEPREFRQNALGSGVIVRENGIVLTANHVVEDAENIKVILPDQREFDAEVVGTDPETDLAVLKVDADGSLPVIVMGSSANNRVGDWVLALGNPFGQGLAGSVTAGIISAKGRSDIGLTRYEDFIQTDAAINPGNSGGPLVNLHGELIGINTAIATRSGGYQGVGFAIPVDLVAMVMDNILTEGRVVRGWLGVYIRDLDSSLREAFAMDRKEVGGVLIDQVVDGSPADDAGLKDGDIILSMEGKSIADGNDLRFRTASFRPGSKIDVKVLREGKHKTIEVELGELESTAVATNDVEPEEDLLAGLGLELSDLTDEIRGELRLASDIDGVVVMSVENYSVAAEAGLRLGDVIIKAARHNVDDLGELMEIVEETPSGEILLLKVITNATRRFVAVRMP